MLQQNKGCVGKGVYKELEEVRESLRRSDTSVTIWKTGKNESSQWEVVVGRSLAVKGWVCMKEHFELYHQSGNTRWHTNQQHQCLLQKTTSNHTSRFSSFFPPHLFPVHQYSVHIYYLNSVFWRQWTLYKVQSLLSCILFFPNQMVLKAQAMFYSALNTPYQIIPSFTQSILTYKN